MSKPHPSGLRCASCSSRDRCEHDDPYGAARYAYAFGGMQAAVESAIHRLRATVGRSRSKSVDVAAARRALEELEVSYQIITGKALP